MYQQSILSEWLLPFKPYYRILTDEEIETLIAQYHKGRTEDPKEEISQIQKERAKQAHDTLVYHNARLVAHIVRSYTGQGVPIEDLLQEGMTGVMRAVEKYNPRKGVKLSSYAGLWIHSRMRAALKGKLANTIHLPMNALDAKRVIENIIQDFIEQHGYLPDREETWEVYRQQDEKNGSEKFFNDCYEWVWAKKVSLQSPIQGTSEEILLEEALPDPSKSPSIVDAKRVLETQVCLRQSLLHRLELKDLRLRHVIEAHYGLLNDPKTHRTKKTFNEIGEELGCTKARAQQLHVMALKTIEKWTGMDRKSFEEFLRSTEELTRFTASEEPTIPPEEVEELYQAIQAFHTIRKECA